MSIFQILQCTFAASSYKGTNKVYKQGLLTSEMRVIETQKVTRY